MVLRAHAEDAKAIVIFCDLWAKFDNGAGRGQIPGDNSSWTKYEAFVDNIVGKVKAMDAGVAASIQFELWNEPARGFFWRGNDQAAWSQYLAMWSRGFKRLRAAIPAAVIIGPSIWGGADPESKPGNATAGLFNQWLDETKKSDTFPDILSWHVLYDSFAGDYNPSPAWEVPRMKASLAARGLPTEKGKVKFMINEYGGGKAQNGEKREEDEKRKRREICYSVVRMRVCVRVCVMVCVRVWAWVCCALCGVRCAACGVRCVACNNTPCILAY